MAEHSDLYSAAAALGRIAQRDIDAMKLLFRVECLGEDFHNDLADRIGNAEAAGLLRRNAREERAHAERVRRAIGLKLGHPWQPAAAELERYPVALAEAISGALLPVIVKAEIDGAAGYERWAERETDAEVQWLLRQNGREETEHGRRVTAAIEILAKAGG
ncbi:MAG TPA: ferritin family protein [Candidatus Binatia bacterium]|nr:ferritin family protein [Candidatus Binatia bacterium]